jgi:hypothetical protein
MRTLALAEAIEFADVGFELVKAFRAVEKLARKERGPVFDRWLALALRYNELRGVWAECPACGQQPLL